MNQILMTALPIQLNRKAKLTNTLLTIESNKSDTDDSPTDSIELKHQIDKYFVDYRIKVL